MAVVTTTLQDKTSVKDFKTNAELYQALEGTTTWQLQTIDETTTNPYSPEDEFYRLRVLKSYGIGILDTPEPEYDCIAQEAAVKFQVESVVISICDLGRIWCKSSHNKGTSNHEAGLQDRNTSFEGHVVQLKKKIDVLVVPDASKDLRFLKNPLVIGAGCVRFFAGAPIRSPEGVVLGSVSLLDSKPRPQGLDAGERDQLVRFAVEVALNLVLR